MMATRQLIQFLRALAAFTIVAAALAVAQPASAGMGSSQPRLPHFPQPRLVIPQPSFEAEQQCPPGMVLTHKGCRCPRGTKLSHGTCMGGGEMPSPGPIAHCGPGEVFSQSRGACVCRRGFVRFEGQCVRPGVPQLPPVDVVECGHGEVFSASREACVCRKGLTRIGGVCQPPQQVAECGPNAYFSPSRQACRCRKGFVAGEGGCFKPERLVKPQPQPQPQPQPRVVPVDVPVPLPRPRPERSAAIQCLPGDLWDMMKEVYGSEPSAQRCDAACLPRPLRFGDDEATRLSSEGGFEWCPDSCISIAGYLPLDDIARIEQAGGITLCLRGGAEVCAVPGIQTRPAQITEVRVRQMLASYPQTLDKDGDIAVVIGNESYDGDIPVHASAGRDADAVTTLLTEKLGYSKDNIVNLRNATLADLRKLFGGDEKGSGAIELLYGKRDRGNIFVYVAGHGMADAATGKPYLLPADARTAGLAASAYPLDELYDRLARMGAGTILLALEASFGGEPKRVVDPPNLPEAEIGILPEKPVAGLTVITASDRDQHALDDPEYGLSLFTRYLIEGMAGKADQSPVGNDDKRLDTVELYVYVADAVRTAARKTLGMEQKPQLARSENQLVGRLAQR